MDLLGAFGLLIFMWGMILSVTPLIVCGALMTLVGLATMGSKRTVDNE